MKTIIVTFIYENTTTFTPPDPSIKKNLAFNTEATVVPGDIIKSPNYTNNLIVMYVFHTKYSFVNSVNGKLSCSYTSLHDKEIRPLILEIDTQSAVTGNIIGHRNL